jgi:hypothetical protein
VKINLRFRIFHRDCFTCQYCGRSAPEATLHVDHVTPRSHGGDDQESNLITACQDCNLGKSDLFVNDDLAIHVIITALKQNLELSSAEERFIRNNLHKNLTISDRSVIEVINFARTVPSIRGLVDFVTEPESSYVDDDRGPEFGNHDYPDPLDDGSLFMEGIQ